MTELKSFPKHEPDLEEGRPLPMEWSTYVAKVSVEWEALLNSDPVESAVQSFLELHPSMIPGGCGDIGPGGHHGPQFGGVFREPPLQGLGKKRLPDFMWVTRSTTMITPICIEIEKPGKKWFTSSGQPNADLTQAKSQITDWKLWFSQPENQSIFRKTYLNEEFSNRDLVPQYLLIYGRASEFDLASGVHKQPDVLRQKRDMSKPADEHYMTFDSLRPKFDLKDMLTISMTSSGPEPWAISPAADFGPYVMSHSVVMRNLAAAAQRTAYWTEERRSYAIQRWDHWRTQAEESEGVHIRSLRRGE